MNVESINFKKIIFLLGINLLAILASAQTDFIDRQKKYSRVRTAISEKKQVVEEHLNKHNISLAELNILLIAYKAEGELTVYAKNNDDVAYKNIISYDICSKSGVLGPKRKQGDYQVPEGFYYIDRFNPASSFYLSLGLNYPNKSDKLKSDATHLGGDIFVHGDCVTIGCLPMTDEKIKEIYLYALYAKPRQPKIPVYIFPFKMTKLNFENYKQEQTDKPDLIAFWKNLKTGYDQFQRKNRGLKVTVNSQGNYIFNP